MTEDQIKIISAAIDDPSPLNQWEYDFVNDIAGWGDNYILSDAQERALMRIAGKYD